MSASVYWARDLRAQTRVVLEDDHLAEVQACEREVYEVRYALGLCRTEALDAAEAMRAACIAAVEALPYWYSRDSALAALREVQP